MRKPADPVRRRLDVFIDAAPQPQRSSLRLLMALQRRPRGRRALGRVHAVEQLANGLLGMSHFEDPVNAVPLGWDADAIAARGRALRREEGRL